jgi:endogenous inhibitor of DNA gyrase (YacG/DUF329 family)
MQKKFVVISCCKCGKEIEIEESKYDRALGLRECPYCGSTSALLTHSNYRYKEVDEE